MDLMKNSEITILEILNSSDISKKINSMSQLIDSNDEKVLKKIISLFDDDDIQIRGEVFSVLCLNHNDISEILIDALSTKSKNIKAFCSLVLANRNDENAIKSIINLTNDSSSMVRSCALGGLGYLNAKEFSKNIHDCFSDSNIEVKRSALFAAICIGDKISLEEISKLKEENDSEIEKILNMQNNSV